MVHRVLGDGNCMFSSISHQLFAKPDKHFAVRSLLARFESKNSHVFSSLLTEINASDMTKHITQMLRPGVWGTHVELFAAATYFQIPVYILKVSSEQHKWEVLRPLGPHQDFRYQLCPEIDIEAEDFNRPDHLELLHSFNCHYDSIITSSGRPTTRPTIEKTHIDCTHLVLDWHLSIS